MICWGTQGKSVLRQGRPIAFVVTAAGAALLLAVGIFREEIGEVMFNAAML